MIYSADEAVSAATITLGVIGVVLAIPAFALFLYGAYRIFRLVAAGKPLPGRLDRPWQRLGTTLRQTFGHTKMFKRPLAGAAHLAVMLGFMFGIVVWFEAFIQTFNPAGGWPFLSGWPIYHFVEEILGLATVIGILVLIGVRLRLGDKERASRFYGSHMIPGYVIEAVVLLSGLGMLLVKASKIATFGGGSLWADFFTIHLANLFPASPVLVSVIALIKLLSGMVFLVFVGINLTWGVAWHRFTAYFNIFFQRNPDGKPANGKLKPMTDQHGNRVTLDTVDDDTVTGVGFTTDASWKMLLDTTTCTECGRCQDLCPAWNTGKPLSPKKVIMDLRDAAMADADVLRDPSVLEADDSHAGLDVLKLAGEGGVIEDDVLWSCTNCGACVDQCPVDIEHIDHITDLRRFQVLADADFPSELAGMFTNIENKGNPWGRNNSERAQWVEQARRDGVDVPVFGEDVHDFNDTEYLFWVGCAGAYDEQGRRTSRAVVDLLHTAGVKYMVLSTGETCTGDPARRAGNEFLFQMQAAQNIDTLDEVFDGVPQGQRKIITTCPHCFNTIRNEYPDFDGHYDVFHHTQLLNRLVRDKWLTPVPRTPDQRKPITYHDPCFLGRHNQVFDPPRELLGATGIELREMDKSRNEAFCCGAGGARMFMEEDIGQRVNEFRTGQAMETGAEEIATACPFCTTMFDGGVKALTQDSEGPKPEVRDVAVRLRDSVLVDDQLPAPRQKEFLVEPKRLELSIAPKKKGPEKSTTPPEGGSTAASAAPATPSAPAAPSSPNVHSAAAETPAAPGAPTAPGVPAAPAAPSTPPAPAEKSAVPGVPGAPASPAVPTAPAAPGMNSAQMPAPPTPSLPSVPGASTPPGTPPAPPAPGIDSAAAENNAAPKAPSVPAAPGPDSARAENPSAPSIPTPPAAPGTDSAAAERPAVPAAPGTPPAPPAPPAPGGNSAAAEKSAIPGAPGAPTSPAPAAPGTHSARAENPAVPSTPSIPAAPAAPGRNSAAAESAKTSAPPVPNAPGVSTAPTPPGVPPAPSAPGADSARAESPSVPSIPIPPAAPNAPAAPTAPPAPQARGGDSAAAENTAAPQAPSTPAIPAAPGSHSARAESPSVPSAPTPPKTPGADSAAAENPAPPAAPATPPTPPAPPAPPAPKGVEPDVDEQDDESGRQ